MGDDTAGVDEPHVPADLAAARPPSFVGRAGELDAIAVAWAAASSGHARAVFVGGGTGSGKSSLAAQAATVVDGAGAVIYGRADRSTAAPFEPFDAIVGQLLRSAGADPDARPWHDLRPLLVPSTAEGVPTAAAPPAAEADAARYRMFEAVAELVRQAARRAPVAIIVDDLNEARRPALHLLRHVLRSAHDAAVLFIGTYRDDDVGRSAALTELLADVRRDPGVVRLVLPGWTPAEVETAIDARVTLPPARRAGLAKLVHDVTDGNPLFVDEVVRGLVRQRALESEALARAAISRMAVPAGVAAVIAHRLEALSDDARRVLATAAVQGAEFDTEVVEAVLDPPLPPDDVLDALDDAVHAHLVGELGQPGAYRFTHGLIRSALYEQLDRTVRERVHNAVGEQLAVRHAGRLGPVIGQLAHHFVMSGSDPVRAAELCATAAARATASLADEDAAAYLDRALALLERAEDPRAPDARFEVLLALATVRTRLLDAAGARDAAMAAAAIARADGWRAGLARAAAACTVALRPGVLDSGVKALCDEVLEAGVDDPGLRAQVLVTLANHVAFSPEPSGADALARRALEAAVEAGDDDLVCASLEAQGYALLGSPDLDAQLEAADALLTAAPAANATRRGAALRLRARAHLLAGQRAEFERDAAEVAAVAEGSGWRLGLAQVAQWRAMSALLDGRLDEVEPAATDVLTYSGDDLSFLYGYGVQILWLRYEQGRHDEMQSLLDLVRRGDPAFSGPIDATAAFAAAVRGDHDEATALLQQLASGRFRAVDESWGRATYLGLLAEAASRTGLAAVAGELLDQLGPWSGRLLVMAMGTHAVGAADRFLAMLHELAGEPERALGLYESAVELETAVGAPLLAARSRLHVLRLQAGRRDRSAAGDAARAVLELARATGAAGLAAEATQAMALIAEA